MSFVKRELLNKFLAGNCSQEEEEYIYGWFNNPELEKELKDILLQQLQDLFQEQTGSPDFELEYMKILKNIQCKIDVKHRNPIRKIAISALKVAAAIIVIFSISFITYNFFSRDNFQDEKPVSVISSTGSNTELIMADGSSIQVESDESVIFYDKDGQSIKIDSSKTVSLPSGTEDEVIASLMNTIVVPYGKRSNLILSDGTVVYLNSGSSLSYPPVFTGKNRKVFLSGEAYFIVTEDNNIPFIVEASNLKVQVLGTEFNICAYNEDPNIETVLVKGSLKVSDLKPSFLKKNSTILSPGQMASYLKESGEITDTNVNPEFYVSWKDGYSIFDRIDLENLVMKLSRIYNKSIEINDSDLRTITFSGKLEQKQTLNEVMEIISLASHFTYMDEGDQILILK
jgi:hypothetical protein